MKGLFKTRLLFAVVAFLLCFCLTSVSFGQAIISIDPAESPSPGVGGQLTVHLKISNGRDIIGYEVNVHFDTSALRYVSGANGSYLPAGAFFVPPKVSGGKVVLAGASGAARSGSGTLASVTFSVVAVKTSTIRLTDAVLSDSNVGAVSVSTRNGSVVESRAPKWDVNRDGIVNVFDLARVAKSLGSKDVRADVTGDGVVNVFDLALVAKHLGESTTGGTTQVSVTPSPSDPFEGMELIPAGEFRMGSNTGLKSEKPVHSVYVDAFYMDTYEVTNAEYAEFLNAQGKHAEAGHTWLKIGSAHARIEYVSRVYRAKAGYENHPVTYVSWYGAMAYAAWKGKRLPTEAEWEKAARGGLAGLKYPWGNSIDSTRANYDLSKDTTSVGKYTPNGYGLYDMSGNVWEWCLDEYNIGFYAVSPSQNPLSGASSIRWILDNYTGINTARVFRGGGLDNSADLVRVASRAGLPPTSWSHHYGFRCVRSVSPLPSYPPFGSMELIPAGEFRMGSNTGNKDEQPFHPVYVDAFYIDTYEVTNAEYAEFLNAKGKHAEAGQTWLNIGGARARIEYVSRTYRAKVGYENHPVTYVTWYGAMAYAQWAGKRLPTEAEWEKAARGGLAGPIYPWGSGIDSSRANYNNHIKDTTVVGKYVPNGYGLYDMAGNVWEWCLDEYNNGFYAISPSQNPLSGANSIIWILDNYTGIKSSRVLRGGSLVNTAQYMRVANRFLSSPTSTGGVSGFRCVRSVSP